MSSAPDEEMVTGELSTAEKDSGIMWSDCPGDQRGWTSLLCPCLSFLSVNVFVFICTLLALNVSSHWGENLAW